MIPVFFSFGPIQLHSYGAMVGLGVLTAFFLMIRRASKAGLASETVYDLLFTLLLWGFTGARIFYVIENWDWYVERPLQIFAVWEGGLIFFGGLVAAVAGLWIYCRQKKISFTFALDFLIPYGVLGHAFGRLGCFLNGCCYGKACDLPWAVEFPQLGYPVHPTQLYEAIFNFLLSALLLRFYSRRKFDGQITGIYFLAYALGRFALEFLRDGNTMWFFLTANQWICFGLFAAGLFLLFGRKPSRKAPRV